MRTVFVAMSTLLLLTVAFATTPAFSDSASGPKATREIIVGFAPGMLPDVSPGSEWNGLDVLQVVPSAPFLVVRGESVDAISHRLDDVAGIEYIEVNGLLHSLVTPNDPRYSDQYGPPMMGFPAAWEQGYGEAGVVVAVLDTGIQKSHPDFDPALLLQGYDYSNDDNDPTDDCGHGTHVSGTVGAATDNGVGVAGMSRSSILHMKVLAPSLATCSGSNANIAEAIYDATAQGARIISMSLGGPSGSTTLKNAVDHAWANGVLVLAAAGNDGPCLLPCVNYPAAYDSVIAVGALTSSKTKASYSSTGPQVEISAPGSSVLSTYTGSSYRSLSGTSMATPHVAGALALALSCRPDLSASDLRGILHTTAEDLGSSGRDSSYGYGLARIDRIISQIAPCGDGSGGGGGSDENAAPTASFTATVTDLEVAVDGSGSSDPDADALTYAWSFGDGATATGVTATHAYAAAGTYTVTLTVDDGRGGTDTASTSVTVTSPDDPDPSTPTVANGEAVSVTLASGADAHYKIFVPAGQSTFEVVMSGPSCGLLSCSFDADLYVRQDQRATDADYDCRPFRTGNSETCTFSSPASAWWYIRVDAYKGSGTVSFTPTHS